MDRNFKAGSSASLPESWTLNESKLVKALNGFILRLLHIPVEVLNDLEYPDQGQALLGYQFGRP
jgi:hypothetical protein